MFNVREFHCWGGPLRLRCRHRRWILFRKRRGSLIKWWYWLSGLSLDELIGIHCLFNVRKFSGKPHCSLWCEVVVLTDVLESIELRFRGAPAILGQLDNFFRILLGDATFPLTENSLIHCFQQGPVVADPVNRLIVTLCHVIPCCVPMDDG